MELPLKVMMWSLFSITLQQKEMKPILQIMIMQKKQWVKDPTTKHNLSDTAWKKRIHKTLILKLLIL